MVCKMGKQFSHPDYQQKKKLEEYVHNLKTNSYINGYIFKNYNRFATNILDEIVDLYGHAHFEALRLLKSGKTCRDGYHTTFGTLTVSVETYALKAFHLATFDTEIFRYTTNGSQCGYHCTYCLNILNLK